MSEDSASDDVGITPPRRAISRRLRFEILRRDGHACRYCGAMAPDVKLTVDHLVPVALAGGDEPHNLLTACVDCNNGKASTQPDSALVEDIAADAIRWKNALEAAANNLLADRELNDDLTARFEEQWSRWTFNVNVTVPAEPEPLTGDALVDNWNRLLKWMNARHSRPVDCVAGVLRVQIERGWVTDVRRELSLVGTRQEFAARGLDVTSVEVVPGWPGPLPAPRLATTRTEQRTNPLPGGWRGSVERFASLGLPEQEIHRLIGVAMEKRGLIPEERFRFFCGCCWRTITDLQEDARRIIETES